VIAGRAGGVLLHPTSLPGPYGIGDLGPAAHDWVQWLARSGCRLWQVLPLGPTGYGDSPYQSFSAFAGNPLLISPDLLVQEGLLTQDELAGAPAFPEDHVDFGPVIAWKDSLLSRLTETFDARASDEQREAYLSFRDANQDWLEDFALFMAVKRAHSGTPWTEWSDGLRCREPEALVSAARVLHADVQAQCVRQFLFFRQWGTLADAAHAAGIALVGDIPIFVAHDSADVWSRPEFFTLDAAGQPAFVAGVPPDYFSPTGQRWGNPLYRWDAMRRDGYGWWLRRLRAVLSMVDIVRLDHFRGFEAYWEIPASAPTAETGRWAPGPGVGFLDAVEKDLGSLPLIAEDLGVITAGVKKLRTDFDLPGMKVLQFAFDGHPEHEFLPHNYPVRCVVYTGTHDNDTVVGWYESAPEKERDFCRRYLGRDGTDIAWDQIRAAWASVAQWAIAPLQDLLSLGTEARMNYPSRESGNWGWRVRAEQLAPDLADRLAEFNHLYGRKKPAPDAEAEP
jgi:4-alpha-glucanotransferase